MDNTPRLHGVKYNRVGTPVHLTITENQRVPRLVPAGNYVGRIIRATYINGKLESGMARLLFEIYDNGYWQPVDGVLHYSFGPENLPERST